MERAEAVNPPAAARTDTGRTRSINQDRFLLPRDDAGGMRVYAVCDGMGGHADGEVAAQTAVDALQRGVRARTGGSPAATPRSAIL
jgi:PPM family protein phosphatase